MLFARMKVGDPISDYFCRGNQEQILLLANRMKWSVMECEPYDRYWFWLVMVPPDE